jgi:hypothetical protein
MKNGKLDKEATRIMDFIWSLAEEAGGSLKIDNTPGLFMALVVEIISPNQISLCHYGEQNGDPMRDPEMVFFKNPYGEYLPIYFRNDYVGVEETSAIVDNSGYEAISYTERQEKQQRDEARFAEMWLRNILLQQNLQLPKNPLKYIPIISSIFCLMIFICFI